MLFAHVAAVALSVALLRNGETILLWLSTVAERTKVPEVRLPAIPRATYPAAPPSLRHSPRTLGSVTSSERLLCSPRSSPRSPTHHRCVPFAAH